MYRVRCVAGRSAWWYTAPGGRLDACRTRHLLEEERVEWTHLEQAGPAAAVSAWRLSYAVTSCGVQYFLAHLSTLRTTVIYRGA